jgi:hypothetical protein
MLDGNSPPGVPEIAAPDLGWGGWLILVDTHEKSPSGSAEKKREFQGDS